MLILLEPPDMDCSRNLCTLLFLLCVLISLRGVTVQPKNNSPSPPSSESTKGVSLRSRPVILTTKAKTFFEFHRPGTLIYDYYRYSCPQAERIVRSAVRRLTSARPDIAPALLRLVFHDCFIGGCDASVLLDSMVGIASEKEVPPNETLKGFDVIEMIKSELEEACPGVVSCADTLVLAARESVILGSGPFYPLRTGRRDSLISYSLAATYELPSPKNDVSKTIATFASRGFNEREIVSLLGAHSIGSIHCKFITHRLYNFDGTKKPDPSIDPEFLHLLRSRCNSSQPSSPAYSSPKMDYEGHGIGFDTLYYRKLLQSRGILYVDQQLTAGDETNSWVRAYASDASLFRRDFARVMMKLSNLGVLTHPLGQVRTTCSKVVA